MINNKPAGNLFLYRRHRTTTMLFATFNSCFTVIYLLLIIILLSDTVIFCHGSCNQLDRDSLWASSMNISSPISLNWSIAADCCTWEGVGCDNNGRVNRLWLPCRKLVGIISPALINLTNLSQLNLSRNLLSGLIPDGFFTSLNQLQIIDLSNNRFSGQIPGSDMLPVTTQIIDLSGNHFNGTVEFPFLQQARNLLSFNVSNNTFSGLNPSFLCNISSSISVLDFSVNKFNGPIPETVRNCLNLVKFRGGFNALSGPLPNGIYKMFNLQELFLPANKLDGLIDDDIVNLKQLRILALDGNEMTGTIPQAIGELVNLEQLLLHINKLNGSVPKSLMNCTRLTILNLRVNGFIGELSDLDFSNLTQLVTVDLGNNFFTGKIPGTLFSSKFLSAIRLSTNHLTGEVPPEIGSLQSLTFLSISNNSLTNITSAITAIKGCRNLTAIVISKNSFNEPFPGDSLLDSEAFQKLQLLGFGGCNFTGPIPSWLARLKSIKALDLSQNLLTGSIPGWISNLSNLFYFDVSQNLLTGNFPVELTGIRRLATEQAPDNNQIYLALPVIVQPDNISSLLYNQMSTLPPSLYLEKNNLSGNIPPTIGKLKFIQILDLSDNNFSGNIPSTMSDLTNLEQLDLSRNHLSGEIPDSLKNLHFLSSFKVAYNNLSGLIPQGGQFDTFPASSYEGNRFLCGSAIQYPCRARMELISISNKTLKKRIIKGLIIGLSIGIGIIFSVLAFCRFFKRKILPKSDSEKTVLDNTGSFNSNSGTYNDFESSLILLFPGINNCIKDMTMIEILKATNNFSNENIIGCGGFGMVYKATLGNGSKVAIKKLSGDMGLMDREFKAEVEALSTARHENLVALQGYCIHEGSRLLIYPYMENGSLDYWLHEKPNGKAQLDWLTRLRIAQNTGNGLAYMHEICEPHIIHRDIKSSNILLDEKFKAYVADFGLARLILPYRTHVTTELVGTLGYIPPEYSQSLMVTMRGDIYSFGVVMLELLTGQRPVEIFRPKMSAELVSWVQLMRKDGNPYGIFDPLLKGKGFENEMMMMLDVACKCINQDPFKRPTIKQVVDWLHEIECYKHNIGTQDLV